MVTRDPSLLRLSDRLNELPNGAVHWFEGPDIVQRRYPLVAEDLARLKRALHDVGLRPGMRVGAVPSNRYEWLLLELALVDLECVSVVFPPEAAETTPPVDLCDRYDLNLLLSFSNVKPHDVAHLGDFADVETGRVRARPVGPPSRELDPDVFTMVFSSGTTGRMKCLMISRRGTEEQIRAFGRAMTFRSDDSILVALPFSIYQQRLMLYTALWYGFDILITRADRIFHALKDMRPTIVAGPPMLYEAVERHFQALRPAKQRTLNILADAIRYLSPGPLRRRAQRRVFASFHQAFGGRTRFLLSGAAANKRSTLLLFERVGLPLYQAYGLTETGFLSWNLPGANRIGSVGRPVFDGSLKFAADGEIIAELEWPQTLGYFDAAPDESRQTFLARNRIATGDIGRLDEHGYLHLAGRKKEIIVTNGGYKVHPQDLEQKLVSVTGAARAVVFNGEPFSGIVALLVTESHADLARMRAAATDLNRRIPQPSRIARVMFTETLFTPENGLLNRNLKVNRQAVKERFERQLVEDGPVQAV